VPTTPTPGKAPVAPLTGGTRRAKPSLDASTWETWWELNRVEFFPRRYLRPETTKRADRHVLAGPQPLDATRVANELWPALLKLSGDQNVLLRETALIALGRTAADAEQRAQARRILQKSLTSRNHIIARSSALGLFYVADQTSLLPMYKIAADEKVGADVRVFLALTLTNLGHPMAAGLLQKLATTKRGDPEVVSAALMGLGYVGATSKDAGVSDLLYDVAFVRKGVRSEHRALAVESFGRIGSLHGLPTLLKGLKDRDANVRRSAAIALGVLDYATAADREIRKIEDSYREYIGVPVSTTDLARIEALRGAAKRQRPMVAAAALRAVKHLGAAMTHDSDAFVRRMAAISLGRIDAESPQPLAVRYLHGALGKNRVGLREFALLGLAISNAEGAMDAALKGVKSHTPSTRGAACIAMGLIANKDRRIRPLAARKRAVCDQTLRAVMRGDRNPVIRGYAALASGIVGTTSSARAILAMVHATKAPTPRGYGALGLALLGTRQGTDDVVQILRSRDARNGFVASHVVYAIGLTKDRRPSTLVTLIERSVGGNNRDAQAASIAALGYLSSGEYFPRRHLMARGYNYLLGLPYVDRYFYKL